MKVGYDRQSSTSSVIADGLRAPERSQTHNKDYTHKKPSEVEGRRIPISYPVLGSHIRFRDPPCLGWQVGMGVDPFLDVQIEYISDL